MTDDVVKRLTEALRAMCDEFRGHDLPYGSAAYQKANALLNEIETDQIAAPMRGMMPISTCPGYNETEVDGDDAEPADHPDVLVYIEHFMKPHLNRFVVGHFVEDGFKLSDGDELNFDYTPTMWLPLPEPKVATNTKQGD